MPLAIFIYSLATQTIDSRRHFIETTEFPPDYVFTILNIEFETSNLQTSMVWPTRNVSNGRIDLSEWNSSETLLFIYFETAQTIE